MKEKSYNGFASEEQYEAVKKEVEKQIGEFCDDFRVERHSGFVTIYVKGMEIPMYGDDFFNVKIDWVELRDKTFLNANDINIIRNLNPKLIGIAYYEEQIRSLMPF
jgi:hypothetical protein